MAPFQPLLERPADLTFFKAMLLCLLAVSWPVSGARAGEPLQILVMGDSMLAAHRISARGVSNTIARALKAKVRDQSLVGARIIYNLPITGALGMDIRRQYRAGPWDWIVVNGGGNDLWMGCGCTRCQRKMNRLINREGTGGEIPKLLMKLRKTGAQVIYVGYLRSPGMGSPIEHCRDDGDELERRAGLFAGMVEGIHFLSIAQMVPDGDSSFHAVDMIHPSLKGSREIGLRVARLIARVENAQ